MESDEEPVIKPGHGSGSDVTGMDWSNACENVPPSSCADRPSVECMEGWLMMAEYSNFKRLVETRAGKDYLHEMAGELFSLFVSESILHALLNYKCESLLSNGLRFLLEEMHLPVDVRSAHLKRTTLLLSLVDELNVELVQVCLRCGADPNMETDAAHAQEMHNRLGTTAYVPDALTEDLSPALHMLIERSLGCLVHQLFRYCEHGLICGTQPQSQPADHGKRVLEVARLLCQHGSDVRARNKQGFTPVMLLLTCCGQWLRQSEVQSRACSACSLEEQQVYATSVDKCASELLHLLIQHGAELPKVLPGEISLHSLLMKGFPALVREIVSRGMDVCGVDGDGKTPLHYAIVSADAETVECLLEAALSEIVCGFRGTRTARPGYAPMDCTLPGDQGREMDQCPSGDLNSCTDSWDSSCDQRGQFCVASLNTGQSMPPGLCDDLICAAIQRGDVNILRALCTRLACSRPTLLRAAFALDAEVLGCLLEHLEWPDTDIADVLKLQAAVYVAVDRLNWLALSVFQEFNSPSSADPKATDFRQLVVDTYGDICRLSMPVAKIQQLSGRQPSLLLSAEDLLDKAVQVRHTVEITPRRAELNVWGRVVREAITIDDLEQLRQLKGSPHHPGSQISGTHFHSLLVLQRLAPESHLYVRYALSLIMSLWSNGGCRMDSYASQDLGEIPVLNLPCCSEVLLQLCSTTLLLGGAQLEGVSKDFGKIAVCMVCIGEAFRARQLDFNVVPWLTWLGHMVRESPVNVILSSYLAIRLLSLLARAKPEGEQLRCAAEAIGTARKSDAHCQLFSQVLMLEVFRQFPSLNQVGLSPLTTAYHISGANESPLLLLEPLINQTDVLEHMVEALLDAGFPLLDHRRNLPTEVLVLAIDKCGRLFRAMVRHGLDFLSHRPHGLPLLAVAVRRGNAETVQCMLDFGAAQDWLDFQESSAMEQDLSEASAIAQEVGSRWRSPGPGDDLPDIAARAGNYAILQALHRAGIHATSPATVFEAALHTNPETLEFLLDTGPWTSSVVCDALRLQSACCLMESVSQSLLPGQSHDALVSPTHHCATCQNGLRFQLSSSSTCPCLSTAFRMFAYAVAIAEAVSLSSSLFGSNHCFILQQSVQLSVYEARTANELKELGRIEFPSMLGCTLRGWHFHALLVIMRLGHPNAVQILHNMLLILVGRGTTSCPLNEVGQERETALHTRSADGRITSMNVGFARSLFACIDVGVSWTTQLLEHPVSNWTTDLNACELYDIMQLLGGLAFWLLSNDVHFDIPTVINMFVRLADYIETAEHMIGLLFRPRNFSAKLYLMCVARMRAGTLGRGQLAGIASLLVKSSMAMDYGCDVALTSVCDVLAQGCCTEEHKKSDTPLPASRSMYNLPWDSDEVAAEAVALLFQAGLTKPDVSCGLLHQLLAKKFSRLLGVLAHHGVDIWVCDEIGDTPLIVQACKVSSPTMIRCLLQGWQNALRVGMPWPRRVPAENGVAVNAIVGTASPGRTVQTFREHDLWSTVLERSKDCVSVLEVLTQCGIAATSATLMQSALSLSSEVVSYLLKTSAFTSAEAANSLALHFAFCLWKASEEPTKKCSVKFLEDMFTYLSSRVSGDAMTDDSTATSDSGVQQMDSEGGHRGCSRPAGRRSSAVESLKQAVEACTALPVRPESRSLDIAGYEVQEGWTWDDFAQLAQVSIATDGKQPLSGLLLHGLLVFDRVLPQHSATFEFFRFVTQLPRCKSKPARNTLHLQKLERYVIVVHHVRMWQTWSAEDLTKLMGRWKPAELICEALNLARQLYFEGTIVDTLPLFSWLHCLLVDGKPEAGFDFSMSVQVLLELAHPSHTSAMAAQQLEQVSEILVETCVAGVRTITGGSVLHELVKCVTAERRRNMRVRMRQRPAAVRALRALLAAPGGSLLVNQVDDSKDTAAHLLLRSRKFSRTRDDVLPQLLELLSASGQHWDCFYGQPHSLMEILRRLHGQFLRLKTALERQVPSLQCLAATAAAQYEPQTCQRYLPRLMAEVVAQHRPTPDSDLDQFL